MDKSNIDLSKPAFGPGAQRINDEPVPQETPPAEPQPEKETVEEPEAPAPSVEEPEEGQKVPYSRFKKFHDRALEAEREAAEWRARAESMQERGLEEPQEIRSDTPSWWTELYGDSDASQKAWKLQERANQQLIEEARRQALEAVQSEREVESQRIQENEETIDQNLEALTDYAGHQLSEREQSAILDIVDEYTPKDADGNYLGATIPFEKAWDIYEMQSALAKAPKVKSRDAVAALTNAPSQGEPASTEEQNRSFNPLDWNAWKKRI